MRYVLCIILAGCAAPNQTPVHSHFGGWTANDVKTLPGDVPVDERNVDRAQ